MIFRSPDLTLRCVREIVRGKVNDVFICEDAASRTKAFYTLWVIHDHVTAKNVLEIFEHAGNRGKDSYVESFACENDFCIVFDYEKERPLKSFYMGNLWSLGDCEKVCMNLIMECITVKLPYPLLYLLLEQDRINIDKDRGIHLSFDLDLEKLDSSKDEGDCANVCASILIGLLEPKKKAKATSYAILEKKVPRACYSSFTELYKDVKLAAAPSGKLKWTKRLALFWGRHRDQVFRVLLAVCTILAVLVIVMIVSQLLLGDIPIYRIFINPFRTIGTESLAQ